MTTVGSWRGLTGEDDLSAVLNVLSPLSILELDANNYMTSQVLTNGQVLVGSTGAMPVAASILGTANRVTVTGGPGTITLNGPQDIATTSSPSFVGMTLSGLTVSSLVATTAGDVLQSVTITNANGCNVSFTGATGVLACTMTQNLTTVGTPTFASETLTATSNQLVLGTTRTITITAPTPALASYTYTIQDAAANCNFVLSESAQTINGVKTFGGVPVFSALAVSTALYLDASKNLTGVALINGQLLIGSTGANPVAALITGTANQVIVTNGAGSIGLALPQSIDATSSPSFAGLKLTGLGLQLLSTNISGTLIGTSFASANGVATSLSGGALTISTAQDIRTTATPTFVSETLTATTNQVALGTTNVVTISSVAPTSSHVLTIPDSYQTFTPMSFLTTSCRTAQYTVNFFYSPIYSSTYSTTTTLLAADINKGVTYCTPAGNISLTTDNATNINNEVGGGSPPPFNNISIRWMLVNNSAFTVTLIAGVGVTCNMPNLVVPAYTSFSAVVHCTSAHAVDIWAATSPAVTGTANQVTVTTAASGLTLSLPQSIATTSAVTFASVTLTTSGGTPTALDYYETYTHTTNWNGAYGVAVAGNLKVTRVGRNVTVVYPQILGTCTVTNPLWMATNMPARFCPASDLYIPLGIAQTAAGVLNPNAIAFVAAAGNFQIHNSTGQTFPNAGNPTAGLGQGSSVSYSI